MIAHHGPGAREPEHIRCRSSGPRGGGPIVQGLGGASASQLAAYGIENRDLGLNLGIGIASGAALGRYEGGSHGIRVSFV